MFKIYWSDIRKSWTELSPLLGCKKPRTSIKELVDEGIIITEEVHVVLEQEAKLGFNIMLQCLCLLINLKVYGHAITDQSADLARWTAKFYLSVHLIQLKMPSQPDVVTETSCRAAGLA